MTWMFAFMAGVGVFAVVTAVGPRPVRVRLLDEDRRPFLDRLMDAIFVPTARRVMTATGRTDMDASLRGMERKLAQAGHPHPFVDAESVFSRRLFTAIIFAVFGGVFALLVGMGTNSLFLTIGLAVFGWSLPDRIITGARKERVEQLTLDAASTLDRLAIFVAAGYALPVAIRMLAERPGGAWVGEFRKVASQYAVSANFAGSLDHVVTESGRLPEITRVAERLRAAHGMGGGGVSEALRRMAADARIRIGNVITERGYQNAVLMVIPAFLAIVAATIIIIGPGAVRMVGVMQGP